MRRFADKVALALAALTAILIMSYVSPLGCQSTPQSNLPTTKMQIGSRKFTLEIAADDPSRELGLMHRDSMPSDHGMLFIFPKDQHPELSFWMKNTRIPLDIIYVNSAEKIVAIKPMEPHSLKSVTSDEPAKYAIELNQGIAARTGVKVGDRLEMPKGLPEGKD